MRLALLLLTLAGCAPTPPGDIPTLPPPDWHDCERLYDQALCPSHKMAYSCPARVALPEHCSWKPARFALACCDYLPAPLSGQM